MYYSIIILSLSGILRLFINNRKIPLIAVNCSFFIMTISTWSHLYVDKINLINLNLNIFSFNNDNYTRLGLILANLTGLLFSIIFLYLSNIKKRNYTLKNKYEKALDLLLLALEVSLIFLFAYPSSLIYFFISFEVASILTFFLILIFLSRERSVVSSFQFIFYTLISSIFLLGALLYIYSTKGTLDYQLLVRDGTFDYLETVVLGTCFFITFGVKIPLFPFHTWLPEAHAEAPTIGSVLLAGILLKIGGYGILVYLIPLFPGYFSSIFPGVCILCIFSIVYATLTTISQVDLKKIIAYSSVSHMAFTLLGVIANHPGDVGCVYIMLGHGYVSAALFFCVGLLYKWYSTRNIVYLSGLANTSPIFTVCFFLLILANFSTPGTVNMIGEVLIGFSILKINPWLSLVALSGTFLTTIYSIWMFNRISFGPVNKHIIKNNDLNIEEIVVLIILLIPVLILGLTMRGFIFIEYIPIGR